MARPKIGLLKSKKTPSNWKVLVNEFGKMQSQEINLVDCRYDGLTTNLPKAYAFGLRFDEGLVAKEPGEFLEVVGWQGSIGLDCVGFEGWITEEKYHKFIQFAFISGRARVSYLCSSLKNGIAKSRFLNNTKSFYP